jgi:hypothetical protein
MLKRLAFLAFFIRRLTRGWPHWSKAWLNFWLKHYGDPPSDPP